MQESDKIRGSIEHYLVGKTVLDLGCGASKVIPWAVGVDDWSEHTNPPAHGDILRARIDPEDTSLEKLLNGKKFEVVFSSHALEHMRTPILETIHHWLSFVKPGGNLILYLPDERHYKYSSAAPAARNPAHKHFLTQDVFTWYLEQISYVTIKENRMHLGPDLYSFLVILEKK